MSRLECRHEVTVEVGVRLWCYYDASFGVVSALGTEADPWHDVVMDGSPYKAAGSTGYYNAQRLACEACGLRQVATGDLELVPGTFVLRDRRAAS